MIAKPERSRHRARRVALQDAREVGCICSPEVVVQDKDGSSDMWQVLVFHDSWCPATRARENNGVPSVNVITYLDNSGEAP